jgi:site-specific DNA-methyltransferase (adenine-specific)
MINNRFNVVYHLLGLVKLLFYKLKKIDMKNLTQMMEESTNDQLTDKPAITYSDGYQQCFCSDNLELMKTIKSNTIDLIYCDILYGTGRKFADYQDLKPIRSEIESHYIPRIKEMHRILKTTGSIYLQMDTRINHWMRILMDDIFGYDKYMNEIVWVYDLADNSKTNYPKKHDCILFYKKGNKHIFNHDDIRIEYDSATKKRYNGTKVGRGNKTELNALGKVPNNVWRDIDIQRNNNIYDTQKPKALIERIIKASSNEGDLVADFYLGSGTTAEVCKDLNRNFIGCDINPRAVEITIQRLNDARS